MVREEFRDLLGITAEPVATKMFRWPKGMPQYTLGHLDRVDIIEKRQDACPGLCIAGGAYRGVGIPDCINSGQKAAQRALACLADKREMQPVGTGMQDEDWMP